MNYINELESMLYCMECDSAYWIDPPDENTLKAMAEYDALKWAISQLKGKEFAISSKNRVEFIGQIMDVIEDVLDEECISFPNTKQLMLDAGCTEEEADENECVLYGENYDMFADPITKIMYEWNVLEE